MERTVEHQQLDDDSLSEDLVSVVESSFVNGSRCSAPLVGIVDLTRDDCVSWLEIDGEDLTKKSRSLLNRHNSGVAFAFRLDSGDIVLERFTEPDKWKQSSKLKTALDKKNVNPSSMELLEGQEFQLVFDERKGWQIPDSFYEEKKTSKRVQKKWSKAIRISTPLFLTAVIVTGAFGNLLSTGVASVVALACIVFTVIHGSLITKYDRYN